MDTSFKNELILPDQLPAYEDLVLQAPDPKYWKVIMINLSIVGVFFGVGIGCMFIFTTWELYIKAIICVLTFSLYLILWILYKLSFSKRGFVLREKDIIYKSGVLVEKSMAAPINRIQNIAVEEGFIMRYFNLASLMVYTAAIHGSPLAIRGLPKETAFQLKSELLNQVPPNNIPANS